MHIDDRNLTSSHATSHEKRELTALNDTGRPARYLPRRKGQHRRAIGPLRFHATSPTHHPRSQPIARAPEGIQLPAALCSSTAAGSIIDG